MGPGGRPSADAAPSPLDRVAGSLLDMGFAEAQVRELLGLQPAASPQQLLDVVSEFMLLGVDPGPVCVALRKSPQLLKLPVPRVRKRSAYLRRLGLAEGTAGGDAPLAGRGGGGSPPRSWGGRGACACERVSARNVSASVGERVRTSVSM